MPGKKPAEAKEEKPAKAEVAKWEQDMALAWAAAQGGGDPSAEWNPLAIAGVPPRPPLPAAGASGVAAVELHGRWCEYYYALRLQRAEGDEGPPGEEEAALRSMRELGAARVSSELRAEMRQREERERDRHFPRRLRPVTLRRLRSHYGFDVQSEGLWAASGASAGAGSTFGASGSGDWGAATLPATAASASAVSSAGRTRLAPRPAPAADTPGRTRPAAPAPAGPEAPAPSADAGDPLVAGGSPRAALSRFASYDYSKVDAAAAEPLPEALGAEPALDAVARHLAAPYRRLTWRNSAEQRAHHTLRALFVWLATNVGAVDAAPAPAAAWQKREAGSEAAARLLAEMASAALNERRAVSLPKRSLAAVGLRATWEGVAVASVPADGVAVKKGVRAGMLLARVGDAEVGSVDAARAAAEAAPGDDVSAEFVSSAGMRVSVVAGRGPGCVDGGGAPTPGPPRWWTVVDWGGGARRHLIDVWGAAGGGRRAGAPLPPRPVGWNWFTPPDQFLSQHFPVPPTPPPQQAVAAAASAVAESAAAAAAAEAAALAAAQAAEEEEERRGAPLQLLRDPLPMAAWARAPVVSAAFHAHGLALASHVKAARVPSKAPPLLLQFHLSDPSVQLRGILSKGALRDAPDARQRAPPGFLWEARSLRSSLATFSVVPPDAGEYVFELQCRRPPHPLCAAQEAVGALPAHLRPPPWEDAVAYQVVSSVKVGGDALLSRQILPPTVAQLLEPLYGKVEMGQPQRFRVSPLTPVVEGVVAVCRERPRDAGSARSRGTGSRPPTADKPGGKKPGGKGAPAPAEDPPESPKEAAKELSWPVTCRPLSYDAAKGMYEAEAPALKRGSVDIYVRMCGQFFPLVQGIEVVRQVSSKEKELNGGRPLAFDTDSPEERAAVLTRLTYLPQPPPPPAAALADPAAAEGQQEEDIPPCVVPVPPPDASTRLFEYGASKAVGSYFTERVRRERGAALAASAPAHAASSLPAPRGALPSSRRAKTSASASAAAGKSAATMPTPAVAASR